MSNPQAQGISEGVLSAAQLVQSIDKDRRLAAEVLRKLPHLVTDENAVDFEIEPTVQVPSIKMLAREFNENGSEEMRGRISNNERTTINLIGDITRLAQSLGKGRLNPSWRPLDLTPENPDGASSDPLYRAAVDYGLRFPYEGMSERHPILKESSQGKTIGSWLMPNYSEKELQRTLGEVNSSGTGQVSFSNLFKRAHTTYRRHYYWRPYYYWWGSYWYWRRYYYWGGYWASYTTSHTTHVEPQTKSLDGDYAWIGQTFYTDKAQVLLGASVMVYNYTTTATAAAPKYLLVRCKYGRPVLDDVVCEGTASATGRAYSTNYEEVKIMWDQPVHVKANEQLAIVIGMKDSFGLRYVTDTNRTGGLMACLDHYLWENYAYVSSSSAYANSDLMYNLIVAEFSGNEATIELQPFELSGGISSAKLMQISQNEEVDKEAVQFEVQLNDNWQPLSILDNNVDLPPFVPARLRLRGSADVMPLIHRERTTVTLFRPASQLRFISKPRQKASDKVKITYELAGFKPTLHTAQMKLLINNGTTEIEPTVSIREDANESVVRTVRAEFAVPMEVTEYQIKIEGTTQNASVMFDITSVIELL